VKEHAVVDSAMSLFTPTVYDVLADDELIPAGTTMLNAYVLPAGKCCSGVEEASPCLRSNPAVQVIGTTVQLAVPGGGGGGEVVIVTSTSLAALGPIALVAITE